jgi:DNA polymerase-3 subunit epsilon
MVKFDYAPDGRIICVKDTFSAFNEPSAPIPPEITAMTGITDDMVAGHRIDEAAVNAFVDGAVVTIAHNSGFDRKFSERYWPVFETKAWACSATEIDWRQHGFAGAQLGYLLNGAGFFHQAHRAVDDCHALLEILDFDYRRPARQRSPSCSTRREGRRFASGPSSRRSNSRIR